MKKLDRQLVFDYLMLHKWPYWGTACLTGLVAVFFAQGVTWAERASHALILQHPYVFLGLAPALFLASWALVYYWAPEAKGSGIPQVMASVDALQANSDDARVERFLGLRLTCVKILSALACLLGGGAVGREGPTIQVSASLFYVVSKRINFVRQYVKPDIWVVTGAAAGLAAAFNTPLGGLVYAIEELATQHINKFKTSLIAAVIIAGFSSQMVLGPYLYLGYPIVPPLALRWLPFALFTAGACGGAGALFGQGLFRLSQARLRLFRTPRALAWLAVGAGAITACMIVFIDIDFAGSGKELILRLLFTKEPMEWHLPALRFVAPMLSYLCGGAGGIFAPSLAGGATLGQLLAELAGVPDTNLFVLLGMTAFLTGVTRAPFTAFILVLEMTDRHSIIFPLMLAALVATTAAKMVSKHSFYELMKETYFQRVGVVPGH